MNSKYSIQEINEMIRKNEHQKRYFHKTISPRFADKTYNQRIHISKYYEFFEMARFDIMQEFYNFLKNETKTDKDVNLGNFVVVRTNADIISDVSISGGKNIDLYTALIIHNRPLLEFEQIAYDENSQNAIVKANIKIAIVNERFEKVEDWNQQILCCMLDFINKFGEVLEL